MVVAPYDAVKGQQVSNPISIQFKFWLISNLAKRTNNTDIIHGRTKGHTELEAIPLNASRRSKKKIQVLKRRRLLLMATPFQAIDRIKLVVDDVVILHTRPRRSHNKDRDEHHQDWTSTWNRIYTTISNDFFFLPLIFLLFYFFIFRSTVVSSMAFVRLTGRRHKQSQ